MTWQMDGYALERGLMVDRQIALRGISDQLVLDAMRKVPRHHFVPANMAVYAYEDSPLSIGQGQTISQPYIVALMTEMLGLKGGEKVLEVGTGSGYQAAILCELAGSVYSIERHPTLADAARERLEKAGYTNFSVTSGDGTLGWQDFTPYDAILVTAAAPHVPQTLLDQLADGGRLVIPVGERFVQTLQTWTRKKNDFLMNENIRVVFVPLIGEQGWRDDWDRDR
jgi:protein-L-isoaspartate(D-aspartate) O-methyltransferase